MDMEKTMQIELANEDVQHHRWYYAYLDLPAEEHKIRDAYQRARLSDGYDAPKDIAVLSCARLPEVVDARLDSPTVDELNFLAKRLASLTEDELDVLEAVTPKVIKGDEEEIVSMKDLINLTYGLDDVSVLSNIHSDAELGQFVIENDLHEDIASIPEGSLYLLDKSAVGKMQREADNGVYVRGKYIVANEYFLPSVYNGQQLPQSDLSTAYAFRLEITHPPIYESDELNSKTAWLSLPATEEEIDFVEKYLGMSDIRNCVYYSFESSVPQIESDHFGDMQEFGKLNDLAHMMVEMTPNDQVKFKAVLAAEQPESIDDIIDLAGSLDHYELAHTVDDPGDFFKDYMLRHMDTRMDSHWFDSLLVRNEGDRLLERLGASQTDYGVISARGHSLYELVPYDPKDEQTVEETEDEEQEYGKGVQTLTMGGIKP